MKKYLFLLLFVAVTLISNAQSNNLSFSDLDKSPLDVVMARGEDDVAITRVIYSRPSKNDREIFGKLVPYGQVWRTGANEATEITFYRDVILGERQVAAGTYSLYTIPNEDDWTIIINSNTTQWGNEYDATKNVLEFTAESLISPTSIESFSISFADQDQGIILFLGWDDTIVPVPIRIAG
jgi:hypothetical protein